MIATFGIHAALAVQSFFGTPELTLPPVTVETEYVGTAPDGRLFDAGPAPDETGWSTAEDGIQVDTGDGVTTTDYTTVAFPTYDAGWLEPLCEAKPWVCQS